MINPLLNDLHNLNFDMVHGVQRNGFLWVGMHQL